MPRSTSTMPTTKPATQPGSGQQAPQTAPAKHGTIPPTERTCPKVIPPIEAAVMAFEDLPADVRIAKSQRPPSKLDRMISLLRRPQGASLVELAAATGWRTHSIRGAIAGSLKRKGNTVTSNKSDGIRRYRLEERS